MSLSQFDSQRAEGSQIRNYLTIVRLHKWSILLVTVLAVAASLFYSLRETPTYVSEAQIEIQPLNETVSGFDPTFNLDNEASIAASPTVAETAAEVIGYVGDPDALASGLSVTTVVNTQILTFSYTHTDPATAQERAQAFAQGYLDYRVAKVLESINNQVGTFQEEIGTKTQRITRLGDRVERYASNDEEDARIPPLQARIATHRAKVALLRQTIANQIADRPTNPGSVIYDAYLPGSQSSPQPVRTAVLAGLLGFALGTGIAFLRERLDDRLSGRADLETNVGAAVLSAVPTVSSWRKKEEAFLVTVKEPHSVASEAYRTLRTGVLFAASQRELRTVMVTSSYAEEGKTATSANLGVALAQAGHRVVLVSGDLRKPRLHQFFGLKPRQGLTSVLAGEAKVTDVLQPVGASLNNLRILPSGPIPGNPAELLGSEAMGHLLTELREVSDFVLIDVAPVLAVADAITLAPLTDAVLFVADATRTTRGAVEQARQQLDQVDARLIGAVLNNFDPSKARIYSGPHYGYYSYRHDEPARRTKRSGPMSWSNPRS